MPGENCAIIGCGICRNQKDYGLFKIPPPSKPEWRQRYLDQILKGRVMDAKFQAKIDSGRVWVCEKHYEPDDIYRCKYNDNDFSTFSSVDLVLLLLLTLIH